MAVFRGRFRLRCDDFLLDRSFIKWKKVFPSFGGPLLFAMALTPEAAVTALSHAGALPASAYANVSLPYRGSYPSTYVYSGEFPANFVWGLGTAAYQIEGGWDEGGKGPSIWDTYSGSDGGVPSNGMVAKGHSGAVACDHFHRWKEDVQLMVSLGLKNYRFSISWPRVMPNGTMAGGVNEAGVQFYSDLIDELLAHDIQPYVTLYHWDLPQSLQTAAIPGWLDLRLVEHFGEYAKLCFERFGDRVKFWSTFNEPWTFTVLGYGTGSKAPGGQFAEMSTNPYLAGHTVLLAHARAVRLYRKLVKARTISSGAIGISNNCDYREPATAEPDDIAAAQRANIWWLGWFADPIFGESGDYPIEMRQKLGTRLPSFTAAEKAELKGSADWFGLNHYGSGFAKHAPNGPQYGSAQDPPSYWADFEVSDHTLIPAKSPRRIPSPRDPPPATLPPRPSPRDPPPGTLPCTPWPPPLGPNASPLPAP